MAKRSKKPRDLNSLAAAVVADATTDAPVAQDQPAEDVDFHLLAQESGRKGGLRGGRARADRLSPQRRSEIAQEAARARWSKKKKD
jgi:hypothetical protein